MRENVRSGGGVVLCSLSMTLAGGQEALQEAGRLVVPLAGGQGALQEAGSSLELED